MSREAAACNSPDRQIGECVTGNRIEGRRAGIFPDFPDQQSVRWTSSSVEINISGFCTPMLRIGTFDFRITKSSSMKTGKDQTTLLILIASVILLTVAIGWSLPWLARLVR
jgi:hypothetical protein